MGKMTPHELLINIVGSTVLNIVAYPSAPIAPSGILGTKFGYSIRLPKFGETVQELMKERGAKVPDLLLVNNEKKLLITVECKSGFKFEFEERLSKQIEFYSSHDFKTIAKEMFPDLENHEIWIFCSKKLCNQLVNFVSREVTTKNLTNIIVWGVELKKAQEEALIQKVYGKNLDRELHEEIENEGLVCSLPRIELLVDPTLKYGERVFRIGRRFLSFVATTYLSEKDRIVTLQDFRVRNPDAIMTDRELKRCLRYLLKLVPEIGTYNSATGEVFLAKRPSLDKIQTKLENLQDMTKEEIIIELEKISKNRRASRIGRPKTKQKSNLTKWLPKKGISKSSGLPFDFHDVETLYRKNAFFLTVDFDSVISNRGMKRTIFFPCWESLCAINPLSNP